MATLRYVRIIQNGRRIANRSSCDSYRDNLAFAEAAEAWIDQYLENGRFEQLSTNAAAVRIPCTVIER
jgi:hypothetical protein